MVQRIAVIGGGVIGCSVAWHLAERGLGEVTLLERDRLGSGTTWHSAGNVTWRPVPSHDDTVLYAFDVIDRLPKETGQETGWLRTGRLFLFHTAAALAGFERWQKAADERGVEARMLSPKEAAAMHPLIDAAAIHGAWFNTRSGRLNPADLTAAYAKAARRRGADIVENCKVSAIDRRPGRGWVLATTNGAMDFDAVIVAAGLWSRGLLTPLDLALTQWTCEHFYVIADIAPRLPRDTVSFVVPEDLIYGREEVGGLMVGFFDENAKTLDAASLPEPFSFTLLAEDWDKISPYFERAIRIFPKLEKAPIRRFVNGPESFTPDDLPLIGPVPGHDGLFLCTAMNSGGVTYSAAAGCMVADMLSGAAPRFDAALFRPERFGDRGRDTAWLQQAISQVVSGGYRKGNS